MVHYVPYNIRISFERRVDESSKDIPPATTPEAKAYEERIRVILNAISRTVIGRCLFASLYGRIPIVIIPYANDSCNALTGQRSSDWRKGVGIQFSPETWAFDRCGSYPGYRPVESLFHEMVHASRFTNFGYDGMYHDALDKMKDAEEFLAVMVTNMFRSEQGAQKFNRDYTTDTLLSQADLESFLSSNGAYIDALSSFAYDPLVRKLEKLSTRFNPFRDLSRLQANYQASSLNKVPKL